MTDGTRGSELNEAPKKTEDIKDSLEKQPEVQAAAESVEKATLKPEEKVEADQSFKESEQLDTAFAAAMETTDSASLDGKGESQAVSTDGDSGAELDDGAVDQVVDLRQDSRISDQNSPGDGTRGEEVGYMGGDPEIDPRSEVEIEDPFGKGGGEEVDAGLPGPNQETELGDLASAAAFGGGDSRVGWTGEQSMTDTMDSEGNQKIEYSEKYENDDGSTTEVQTTHENGTTTQTVKHTDADGNTTTETSTDEAPDTSQEEYDPMGANEVEFDDTLGGILPGALPQTEIEDLDDESLMQPAGEEDQARERDPNVVFDRASDVDPYAQYTGEEQENPDIIPDKELEDERVPIDPRGEGIQGSLAALESRVEAADSAKTDQAAAVLQEQALAGKGANDLQALTANVVKAQYEELSDSDNEIMQAVVAEKAANALDDEIAALEDKLSTIGDDAQLANIDLQNMLQKQQQTIQMLSNISKLLHDTALAGIRKLG